MDTIFKIPDGVDFINIKVNASGKEYELPAIKVAGESEVYRIPHKALSHLWRVLRSAQKGLKMETGYIDGAFVGCMTPGYTCVGCRISDATRQGDVYYGETKASNSYSTAEREAPFASAVNRAQDKAILDYLGVESQYFTKDGNPSLYSFDTGYIIDEAGDKAEESTGQATTAPPAPLEETPDPDAKFTVTAGPSYEPLTDAENEEYENLKAHTLKINVKGENKAVALSDMDNNTLVFLASDKHGNDAYRNTVRRFLALQSKKSMAEAGKVIAKSNGGV